MLNWLRQLLGGRNARATPIPDALWEAALATYPFLAERPATERQQLRQLVGEFLAQKEFSGAHGLVVTDDMAVAIAAQACLPVLHLGLGWYSDFVGIVVHPGQMLARRETQDASGVVHRYNEVLVGEAMDRGPVTLSWQDVATAGEQAGQGYNVVIHEFVHKIDMKNGTPDGCPPLGSRAAHAAWRAVMQPAYDAFREQVTIAERFGGQSPWLDAYGATAPAEFFAVACEAYFVNRVRFTEDFAALTRLFDQFFKANQPAVL
jgi:Mlc titration factor MtfA (ptsG expression regulator)